MPSRRRRQATCPECHLPREMTHLVRPGGREKKICSYCASGYEATDVPIERLSTNDRRLESAGADTRADLLFRGGR